MTLLRDVISIPETAGAEDYVLRLTDGVGHDMNSDPHPAHTSCTDMNVGFVAPGQSQQTDVLNIARTCGYHDHNQPSNTNLQGTIMIQ